MVLDSFELINKATQGLLNQDLQQPFTLWKHHPVIDRDPIKNAQAHLEFQKLYNCDLLKISPHGRYCCVDWGCQIAKETDPITGSTKCAKHTVNTIEDWERIIELDPLDGEFGKCLKTVKLISKETHQKIPTVMTIFLPLMTADKLTDNLLEHLDIDKQIVYERLQVITQTMINFANAALDEGADGLFFATQQATNEFWPQKEFLKHCFFDEKVLNYFTTKTNIRILHLHGKKDIFFDWAQKQSVNMINWHANETKPSLKEANFKGALLGGLDTKYFEEIKPEDMRQSLRQLLLDAADNRRRLIVSPGCVIDLNYRQENLTAIKNFFKNIYD